MTIKNDDTGGVSGGEPTSDNTNATVKIEDSNPKRKCNLDIYEGNKDAKGYNWLGVGRGMLVMSNLLIQSSLLRLASNQAGCPPDQEGACEKKVYGLTPSGFTTLIFTVAGLAAAISMPIVGAIVDYTPYRRMVGIVTALLMTAVQGAQIYTVQSTWLIMAILQAFAGAFYQGQMLSLYAYLPDIAREVGEAKMTRFTAYFQSIQFFSMVVFLVVMSALTIGLELDTVRQAQVSQAINTVTCIVFFGLGWLKFMTSRPPIRELPEGQTLLLESLRQNWRTCKSINKYYRNGVRWYFVAVCFAESGAAIITNIAIVYLSDSLNFDARQIIMFILVVLLSTLIGGQIAIFVTNRTTPMMSWKLNMFYLWLAVLIGMLTLEFSPTFAAFIWAVFMGIGLGWYYPSENLIFSMCLPKGQDSEMAGFFVYCTQILVWLPPLIFTVMIEGGVPQRYGCIAATAFFLPAIGFLMLCPSWDKVVEEAKTGYEASIRDAAQAQTDAKV